MYNIFATYKMMHACTNKEYLDRDFNDLIAEYKSTHNARIKNKCIATIFCKIYPMILKMQKKFYTLTPAQKIEHILYNLVIGVNNFDLNKKIKFTTFITTHLNNKLNSLLITEDCIKRKVFHNIVKHNDEIMEVYVQTKVDPSYDYDNGEKNLVNDINNSTFLSSEEKEYCSCLIKGMTTAKEIGKAMKLKEKSNFIAKPLITNPLYVKDITSSSESDIEKRVVQRVKTIKASIKKKYKTSKEAGIDIFRE